MKKELAIELLNKMRPDGVTEEDHMTADRLLLEVLIEQGHKDLADAFIAARDRCGFWYS